MFTLFCQKEVPLTTAQQIGTCNVRSIDGNVAHPTEHWLPRTREALNHFRLAAVN
jgi:hypothetical protein